MYMQSGSLEKRSTPRYNLIKFTNFKDKEILYTSRSKNTYLSRKIIRLVVDYSRCSQDG